MTDRNYIVRDFKAPEPESWSRSKSWDRKVAEAAEDLAGLWRVGEYEIYRDPDSPWRHVRIRRKDGKPLPEELLGPWSDMATAKRRLRHLKLV